MSQDESEWKIAGKSNRGFSMSVNPEQMYPLDKHNRELLSNVHPNSWVNPEPASKYNLVVVGAGTAGLVSAAGAAGLGAKVALVERHLMGGDCLNIGCVPSKALIRSSRIRADILAAHRFGIQQPPCEVTADFSQVMERLRRLRSGISHHDSVSRFKDLGIDVYLGSGKFTRKNILTVENSELRFSKAIIATGARPASPPIPGLEDCGYLTNETVFNLVEQPERLAVIGGGPIGCELAQAFARLGTSVTLIEMNQQFLPREDPEAAEILKKSLEFDQIDLRLGSRVMEVSRGISGLKKIRIATDVDESLLEFDEILIGVGRIPNVENLGLESAGVQFNKLGIQVDDHLRTTNSRIFAAGDVTLTHKFTHTADAAARIVIQNALFKGRKKISSLTVPWCTYTSPEIAHVGLYEHEALEKSIELTTFQTPFSQVDRAILDGEEEGFVKIHVRKGSDEILGATIVASDAGSMISELTLAMVGKIGLGQIASVIHPYPTQAEAIKKTADAFNRTRLTPFVKRLFGKWLSWSKYL